ncbi:MAG: maltose ABC transporter permease [Bifidobacterium breve]|uniref:maltose ABC transporter permease n=1 Tax=Bifidobacterium breve TaxID=1685 RepID=UPI0028FFFE95|nr:maltose ABC transporter permease [Bifidobacterium breve]
MALSSGMRICTQTDFLVDRAPPHAIAPRVAAFFASQTNNIGTGAAAALLAALPVIIAYLFLQRYFIAGMVAGVEKTLFKCSTTLNKYRQKE